MQVNEIMNLSRETSQEEQALNNVTGSLRRMVRDLESGDTATALVTAKRALELSIAVLSKVK